MPLPELDWQLEDYLRAFWTHKWLILVTTLALSGSTVIYMNQQPNIYRATARIVIETQSPRVVQFQEVNPYPTASFQGFLQTEYRVISSRAVVSRVIDELHLASFPPFSQVKDPTSALQGMISVDPVRGTKLVDISVTGTKAELIARIANAVADAYAQLNLERRREMTAGGIQWLQDEVTKMETKVRNSQLALQNFMEQHGSVDFGEEQQNTILQRLQALNATITDTRKQRIEAEAKYREKHPRLLELQAKEQELQLALFDQEQKALEMNRLSIQYNNLLREAKTTESIYNVLLTRLKELAVQEGMQTNNVQIVDHAMLPEAPIGPARRSHVLTAVLLGAAVGCGLAFLFEYLPKTIRNRRDFERVLEMPFLGHVPQVRISHKHAASETLFLISSPKMPVSESIRAIRTTLEFLLPNNQACTLLLTSALPEEGKSFVSMNLAIALQELGRRVLLVDGDLRRPSLHRFFQVGLEPGLSAYLQDKAGLEEIIQVSPTANGLSVVPAGLTPSQPTDLLSSPKLRLLLEKWKQEYQYILIDSPPVLVAADSAVLSSLVDSTIFVVRATRTHGEAALAGKQRLADVGAKLIGGILNGAHLEMERGYRYYYYYRSEQRDQKRLRKPLSSPTP